MFPFKIFCEFAKYLDYGDAFSLSSAIGDKEHNLMKYCNIELDFQLKMTHTLKDMGMHDPLQFIEIIKENDLYISGSFILKILINGDWSAGDIDIYYHEDHDFFFKTKKIIKIFCKLLTVSENKVDFKKNYREARCRQLSMIASTLETIKPVSKYIIGKSKSNIGGVWTFPKINDIKIQLIRMTNSNCGEDIHEYINDTYDFDFCKNVYGPHGVVLLNRQSVLTKTCDLSGCSVPTTRLERITKYIRRGMTIKGFQQYYYKFLSHEAVTDISNIFCEDLKNRCNFGTERHLFKYTYAHISTKQMDYFLRNCFLEFGYGELNFSKLYGIISSGEMYSVQNLIQYLKKFIMYMQPIYQVAILRIKLK